MPDKKLFQKLPAFLMLATLGLLGTAMSREAFLTGGLPVFSLEEQGGVYVALVGDESYAGVRQFNDGALLRDVIMLTVGREALYLPSRSRWDEPLVSGERLVLVKKGRKIDVLRKGWMSASQRIALGIPLHPDRMSQKDWESLPGIGAIMAERIELDRQNNGDFRRFSSLDRVKGIGKRRLSKWEDFF